VIPVLGNYMIYMFKDSALLMTLTVLELFGSAYAEASRTYRFLEPFTLMGLIYLAMSYPAGLLVRRLEARLAVR
jgi:polar amino acid transport system permease protein